eukprot:6208927-Pleurochrysis_carterae.AAC.3
MLACTSRCRRGNYSEGDTSHVEREGSSTLTGVRGAAHMSSASGPMPGVLMLLVERVKLVLQHSHPRLADAGNGGGRELIQ